MGNCQAPDTYVPPSCCGGNDDERFKQPLVTPKQYDAGTFFRGSTPKAAGHMPGYKVYQSGPSSKQQALLIQLAADAQAIRAVIKLQALFRGFRDRKMVKTVKAKSMRDKMNGYSATTADANLSSPGGMKYQNVLVTDILNKIGSFKFKPDDEKLYGTSEQLEIRPEQETANGVKYEG